MTIPWGDVYTAFVSTGIANIEVYMSVPPSSAKNLRRIRWLGPVLGTAPVQALLKRQITRRVRGPSLEKRASTEATIWGEVRDEQGRELKTQSRTPNGYALTVTAALGIAEHLLSGARPAGGYYTPSLLMGADYVLTLPGVSLA